MGGCPSGELSWWGVVLEGSCPSGELSLGELSRCGVFLVGIGPGGGGGGGCSQWGIVLVGVVL